MRFSSDISRHSSCRYRSRSRAERAPNKAIRTWFFKKNSEQGSNELYKLRQSAKRLVNVFFREMLENRENESTGIRLKSRPVFTLSKGHHRCIGCTKEPDTSKPSSPSYRRRTPLKPANRSCRGYGSQIQKIRWKGAIVRFEECSKVEAESRLARYAHKLASISAPIDSFVEERLLASQHFKITDGDRVVGLFSIENEALLTHFEIDDDHTTLARGAFIRATKMLNVQEALVATFDETFLGLAFDYHRSVKPQAYLFREDASAGKPSPVPDLCLETARQTDKDLVLSRAGDFFDKIDERIERQEIQVARANDSVCGFGIIEIGRFATSNASIGVFVRPEFRGRGVARSILGHLKSQAQSVDKRPVAGCWYYNHASLRALEGAGMAACSRLLRFQF